MDGSGSSMTVGAILRAIDDDRVTSLYALRASRRLATADGLLLDTTKIVAALDAGLAGQATMADANALGSGPGPEAPFQDRVTFDSAMASIVLAASAATGAQRAGAAAMIGRNAVRAGDSIATQVLDLAELSGVAVEQRSLWADLVGGWPRSIAELHATVRALHEQPAPC